PPPSPRSPYTTALPIWIHPAFAGQFEPNVLDRLRVPHDRFQAGDFRPVARVGFSAGEHDAPAPFDQIITQELQFLRTEHGIDPADRKSTRLNSSHEWIS